MRTLEELDKLYDDLRANVEGIRLQLSGKDELEKLRREYGELADIKVLENSKLLLAEKALEDADKARVKIRHYLERVVDHFAKICASKSRLSSPEFMLFLLLRELPHDPGITARAMADSIPSVKRAWKKYMDETGGRSSNQPDAI
ncbi:MAG TPA: hypothetical protein VJK09_00185 [Candidatus Paceibacterota bacterium]